MSTNEWDEEELTAVEQKENIPPPPTKKRGNSTSSNPSNPPTESHVLRIAKKLLSLQAALPRDRFAAFLLDKFLLFYITFGLWPSLSPFFFKLSFLKEIAKHHPVVFLLFYFFILEFIYYSLFEVALRATPGKLICRLRVFQLEGGPASPLSVLKRNFFRFIDELPIFLSGAFSMENSPFYQRIGDRLSQTVVIKKTRKRLTPVDIKNLSSTSSIIRFFALIIDLLLIGGGMFLVGLNLDPDKKILFQWIKTVFPLIPFFYFFLFEFLISSTPGKIIFNRTVFLNNGEPLDGSAAFIRTFFRPIDLLLGYPLILLSPQKQRLGDLLADTQVIRFKNSKKLISFGIILLIGGTLGLLSTKNPNRSWFTSELNILEQKLTEKEWWKLKTEIKREPSPTTSLPRENNLATTSLSLKIEEFYMANGPSPAYVKENGIFSKNDTLYLFFRLTGFNKNPIGETNIIQGIRIEAPSGELLTDNPKVIESKLTPPDGTLSLLFANQITFSPLPNEGEYKIWVILKDVETEKQIVLEKTFTMK